VGTLIEEKAIMAKVHSGSILIVDPDEAARNSLTNQLKKFHHSVAAAGGSEQAVELMQAQLFDVLLVDVTALETNDYQLLEMLYVDPALSQIPVIVVADPSDSDRLASGLERGGDDYLLRPVTDIFLKTRIEANLERKELRERAQGDDALVKQINMAQSKFVSFVAHELRTPMTSIKGYADLLKRGTLGPINEGQTNFLNTIITNANRMATLVTNLNDTSRIEADRLQVTLKEVVLIDVIDQVIQANQSRIAEKEQTLNLDIPDDLPPVWADPDRIKQILTNLITNARKYTPQGGQITLTAEATKNRWDPNATSEVVHLAVRDNGLGIDVKDRPRIFEKFFRSEDDEIREAHGTGLGLYLVKHLVELHGGQIWFESEFRQGSTFHITLPVAAHS
jgi:signal transduction histidine kinase